MNVKLIEEVEAKLVLTMTPFHSQRAIRYTKLYANKYNK